MDSRSQTPPAPGPAASELQRRRWRVLGLTSVGAFMGPLDASIVAIALPAIGPSLHLSFTEALWVQASYLLAISILLIPVGRLADMGGRLRLYMLGVVIFGLASLGAALSPSGSWLIAARSVQGIGGALLGATSAAIVTSVFPPQERGRALGINVMAVYIGLAAGPPLGGLLVTHWGWHWIFLVNVPIAIATLAALLNYMAMYSIAVFTALFLEIVQGRSAQQAGFILLAEPIIMAALSPVFGRLSDRLGSRLLATSGMVLVAGGMAQLALLPIAASLERILVALAMVGLGMAAFSAPNTSAVMGSVHRSQLSLASGFLGTVRVVGQGISVTLLGAVAASHLGSDGGRVIFGHGAVSRETALAFAQGYRQAMFLGAALALVGACVSLVRGAKTPGARPTSTGRHSA